MLQVWTMKPLPDETGFRRCNSWDFDDETQSQMPLGTEGVH